MRTRLLSLFLLAAACGDDGGSNTKMDAGPDSGPDIDAPPPAPVKVTVTSGGIGSSGQRVHFLGPDSAVITSVNTDANGSASAIVPDGGFVSVVNPFGPMGAGEYVVYTTAGVKAGDEIVIEEATGGANLIEITIPRDSDAMVDSYTVSTPCGTATVDQPGSGNPTVNISLRDGVCQPTSELIIASHDMNGDMVHWGAGTATVSGATMNATSIALANNPVYRMFTFNNIPSDVTPGTPRQHHLSTKGELARWNLDLGGGTTTRVAAEHITPASGTTGMVQFAATRSVVETFLIEWNMTSTSDYTTDVGARLLRDITGATGYDAATKRLNWIEGAASTGAEAEWCFTYTGADRVGGSVAHIIVGPVSNSGLQFPTLPNEGTELNLLANDDVVSLETIVGRSTGGYDALRERLLNFPNAGGPHFIVTGTTGTATAASIPDSSPRLSDPRFARWPRLQRNPFAQ